MVGAGGEIAEEAEALVIGGASRFQAGLIVGCGDIGVGDDCAGGIENAHANGAGIAAKDGTRGDDGRSVCARSGFFGERRGITGDFEIVGRVGLSVGAVADDAESLDLAGDGSFGSRLGLAVSVDSDFVGVADLDAGDDIIGMAPRIANGIPVNTVFGEDFGEIGSVGKVESFVGGVKKGFADAIGGFQEIGDADGEEAEVVPIFVVVGIGFAEEAIGAGAGGGESVVGALNGEFEAIGSAPGIEEGGEGRILASTFGAEGIEIAEIIAGAGVIGGGNFGEALFLQSGEGANEAKGGEIVAGIGEFVGAVA